jgi:MoxR-like ATPase
VSLTAELSPQQTGVRCEHVLDGIAEVLVGGRDSAELVLLALLAGGHALIEDLPGVGKTLLARCLAAVLGLDFARVQFTPDLLPADLLGASVYNQRTGEFELRRGPVFTQLLLADEINRTPPKTQAALLEAMAEAQVSIDGQTLRLPEPFLVIATDNPVEYEGTYPLPEAQLDRFMVRVRLGYLSPDAEVAMARRSMAGQTAPAALPQLVAAEELLAMRRSLQQVAVDPDLLRYAVQLVAATRTHAQVVVGASPRGTLALVGLGRARAARQGRDYVVPEDIKAVAVPALGHRLSLRPEMWVRRITGDDVIAQILADVPVPRVGSLA